MAFDIDIDNTYSAGERQFILYEYFQKHTGKGHAVSRKEIEAYLNTFDIKISPQTFYNDLDILRGTMKLDIRFDPHVHNKGAGGYWLANPRFEPRELRMMVDGVQSLKFITQSKAQEITRKIKDLADVHTVATLNRQTFVPDRVRNMEDSVVDEADRLHQAIAENSKIKFRYFHCSPNKNKPYYVNNGEKITVSPFALSWNNGNYYLYAYDGNKFRYYRVDRMEGISRPLPQRREGTDLFSKKSLTVQKAKVFNMFKGTEYRVHIRFRNELADVVVDEFGKDITMIPIDDEHFTITVPIEVGRTFYAWIATFGRRVKILGPESVVKGMREFLEKAMSMYKDDGEK